MQARQTLERIAARLRHPSGGVHHLVLLAICLAAFAGFALSLSSTFELPDAFLLVLLSLGSFALFMHASGLWFGWEGLRWGGGVFLSVWFVLMLPCIDTSVHLGELRSLSCRIPVGATRAEAEYALRDLCWREEPYGSTGGSNNVTIYCWASPDQYAASGAYCVELTVNSGRVVRIVD